MDGVSLSLSSGTLVGIIAMLYKMFQSSREIKELKRDVEEKIDKLEKRIFDGEGSLAYRINRLEELYLRDRK